MFRKSALEKLSHPEQLDQVFVGARPRHWIVFLASSILVAGAVAWSIFGKVPTRISAEGIILSESAEVFTAAATASGPVGEISVIPGARVVAGQPVAVVRQSLIERRTDAQRAVLAQMEARYEELLREEREQRASRTAVLEARKSAIEEQLRRNRDLAMDDATE